MINITTHPDFIKCKYNGRDYMHFIPSVTGIIATFGFTNYGYGRNGAIIYVHKDDVKHSPTMYQKIPTNVAHAVSKPVADAPIKTAGVSKAKKSLGKK